jgi:hypothetical protein
LPLEDGTDWLFRTVGVQLPTHAAQHSKMSKVSNTFLFEFVPYLYIVYGNDNNVQFHSQMMSIFKFGNPSTYVVPHLEVICPQTQCTKHSAQIRACDLEYVSVLLNSRDQKLTLVHLV